MHLFTLLFAALLSTRPSPQMAGSGGIAADPETAAMTVIQADPVPFETFRGRVDHAAAGTGLRNYDSGTIRLRGIPPNSTVVRAFLYWAMICPGEQDQCPRSVSIEFEGRTIESRLFAVGAEPCWIGEVLGAYRADVTGLMPATNSAPLPNKVANGDYQINAFPSNPRERDGSDPWVPVTAELPKVEGATLVVIYENPNLPSGLVYMHEGADFFSGTLNVINTLAPPAPAFVSFVKFTRFGADGQVGFSTNANAGISNETTFFLGPVGEACPAAMPQIAGDGAANPRDRDSDWNGHDGEPLNQLWDTRTTEVTGLLRSGAANYCVRYVSLGDCMNAIGYVLTVR